MPLLRHDQGRFQIAKTARVQMARSEEREAPNNPEQTNDPSDAPRKNARRGRTAARQSNHVGRRVLPSTQPIPTAMITAANGWLTIASRKALSNEAAARPLAMAARRPPAAA